MWRVCKCSGARSALPCWAAVPSLLPGWAVLCSQCLRHPHCTRSSWKGVLAGLNSQDWARSARVLAQCLLELQGPEHHWQPAPEEPHQRPALVPNRVSLVLLCPPCPLPTTGHVPRAQGSTGGQGAAGPAPRLPQARPALQVLFQPAGAARGGGGGRAQGGGLPAAAAPLALGGRCAQPAQRRQQWRGGLSFPPRITARHCGQWGGGGGVTPARVGGARREAAAARSLCIGEAVGAAAPAQRRGDPAAGRRRHGKVGGWAGRYCMRCFACCALHRQGPCWG